MGNKIPQEVVDAAKKWSVLDYFDAFEPGRIHKVGKAYRMKDHPSFCIASDGNSWCWHSQGIEGGDAISYLMKIEKMTFQESVKLLTGSNIEYVHNDYKHLTNPVVFPFVLPEKNNNNYKMIDYLSNRGITKEVINYCIDNNILYQSREYSNYVLVSYDDNKKPLYITRDTYKRLLQKENIKDVVSYCKQNNLLLNVSELTNYNPLSNVIFVGYNTTTQQPGYAAKRGMFNKVIYENGKQKNKSFRQEITGSNKSYSFAMRSENDSCNTIHVFEAAIDAMSYASLVQLYSSDFHTKNLLSLGGAQSGKEENGKVTLPLALEEFISTSKTPIKKVYIHFDNDDAGIKHSKLLKQNLEHRGIESAIKLPPNGKDVNDFLKVTLQKLNADKSISARELLSKGR